jgi:hypothetical protein
MYHSDARPWKVSEDDSNMHVFYDDTYYYGSTGSCLVVPGWPAQGWPTMSSISFEQYLYWTKRLKRCKTFYT